MSCDRGVRQAAAPLAASGIPADQARATWGAARIGYTFWRGALPSVSAARVRGEQPDGWAQAEAEFTAALPVFELEDDVQRAYGLWNTPEPSLLATVKGARADILRLARHWGAVYQQEAVAVLLPNPEGQGGVLQWDLGRALSDTELERVLTSVQEVNQHLAAKIAREHDLPADFTVGLSVCAQRFIEFWAATPAERAAAEQLLAEALCTAQLTPPAAQWRGGYDFELLLLGRDY